MYVKSSLVAAAVACVIAATAIGGLPLSPFTTTHHGSQWVPTAADFEAFMAAGGSETTLHGNEEFPELRQKLIKRILSWGEEYLTKSENHPFVSSLLSANMAPGTSLEEEDVRRVVHDLIHSEELTDAETGPDGEYRPLGSNPYPYYAFLPEFQGAAVPGGAAVTWEAPCWGSSSLQASAIGSDNIITVTLTVDQQKSFLCSDDYMAATVGAMHRGFTASSRGAHTLSWNITANTPAERYDVTTRGIRFFLIPGGSVNAIVNIIATALMFVPMTTQGVSAAAAARNMDFLAKYSDVHMENRTIIDVNINETTVQSGDFFGIIRLDGLDPMLGWAMGSTTGHTTVAIREGGTLYIAESTANDSYWPTNGVQKTEFKTWLTQAKAAGMQVVHAPLSPAAAAKFDVDKALSWFSTVEGLNYGYHNLLFGWIDTPTDNYPCVAPNYTQCLSWEAITVLFGSIDRMAPSVSDLIMNQAINIRLGTSGLRMAGILQTADSKKMVAQDLPAIVEEDAWMYNTTRNGKPAKGRSMVCCVFVCSMWKAAGVFDDFGDEVNCGELTNWDDYALNILDAPPRPPQCVKADPNNQLCQLLGDYTLSLNNYSSKAPYAHMAEKCPSEAPHYNRPANC